MKLSSKFYGIIHNFIWLYYYVLLIVLQIDGQLGRD